MPKGDKLTIMQRKFLSAYLAEGTPTFNDLAKSARAAGSKCKSEEGYRKIGWKFLKRVEPHVIKWLDESKLSESALKLKLASLLDAKETKIFAHQGKITDTIDVEALGTQATALQMAMKLRGMLKDQHEVTGKDGGPIETCIEVRFVGTGD